MPNLTIPKLGVLTFHRSEETKAKGGTAKDRWKEGLEPWNTPLSETRPKPPMELRPLSPYTKFPSVKSVRNAVQKLGAISTEAAMVDTAIAGFANRATPKLTIVPDQHGSVGSFCFALTSLCVLAQVPGHKILMIEWQQSYVDSLTSASGNPWSENIKNIKGNSQPSFNTDVRIASWVMLVNAAHVLGFEVRAFDELKGIAANLDAREAQMKLSIMEPVPKAVTTLAIAGASHVGPLHETASNTVDTLVTGPLFDGEPDEGDTHGVKAFSYLLAKQNEMTLVRAAAPALKEDLVAGDIPRLLAIILAKVPSASKLAIP